MLHPQSQQRQEKMEAMLAGVSLTHTDVTLTYWQDPPKSSGTRDLCHTCPVQEKH